MRASGITPDALGFPVERIERILLMHRLLSSHRYGLANERLMEEAQSSRSTVYRDLCFLRDVLGAPLEHEDRGGQRIWRYAANEQGAFQLPGLWLTADELYALLLAEQVLARSGAGLLGEALGRFRPRIDKALGDKAKELGRLRVLRTSQRRGNEAVFRSVAQAVLERRKLRFRYRARSTEQPTERRVSPQRLTHYRDNWYLDALDEGRNSLRSFALDRITQPQVDDEVAQDLEPGLLDSQLGVGYGIFSGPIKDVAVLRFSAHAARWVAEESWHPQQQGRWLADGTYELKVPYSNPRELLMDVLRHGADAQVIGPIALREQMRTMLALSMAAYMR